VPHGLVVPEELEGPVKRPGWNSCDQPVLDPGEFVRWGGPVCRRETPLRFSQHHDETRRVPQRDCSLGWPLVQHLFATCGEVSGKAAGNSVGWLL